MTSITSAPSGSSSKFGSPSVARKSVRNARPCDVKRLGAAHASSSAQPGGTTESCLKPSMP